MICKDYYPKIMVIQQRLAGHSKRNALDSDEPDKISSSQAISPTSFKYQFQDSMTLNTLCHCPQSQSPPSAQQHQDGAHSG
jgi:hypothetical protein